ncbi:MAG: hypothetical protein VX112_02425 [Pseudomonadota bacterium]|nr:hypothetical protein [Pseudomonadota bacterium]
MICNFKTFLISRNALQKDISPQGLEVYFEDWVSSLNNSLSPYKPYLPLLFLEHLLGGQDGIRMRNQIRPLFQHTDSNKSIIQAIDLYYDNLVKTLNTAFIRQMQHIPFSCTKSFYPYQSRHPGVGFTFRLVHSDGKIETGSTIETQSFIGKNNHRDGPTLQEITQCIGKNAILNQALSHYSISTTHKKTIDSKEPHAEDIFFTLHLDEALTAIRKFYKKLPQPHLPPQDDLWLTHLGGPRIEFVQTSSICKKCQTYFKALRHILTNEDIRLPMIMFAKTPFNLNEPSQPVAIINMQGDYHTPALSWSDKPRPNPPNSKEYAHMAILNTCGTAVLTLLWDAPALAHAYLKELTSATGDPDYHIWLAEFTSTLFQTNSTMPNASTGISAPVDKENFPLLKTDDYLNIHKSVCLSSSLSSTDHEITPIKHAFFNLLELASHLKNQEGLTVCETFYWLLFIEISRLLKVKNRPSVTFCNIDLYIEDFIDQNRFANQYLQALFPNDPDTTKHFKLLLKKIETEIQRDLRDSLINGRPKKDQKMILQSFLAEPNINHAEPPEESNCLPNLDYLPERALNKLTLFCKERSEYISKDLSL